MYSRARLGPVAGLLLLLMAINLGCGGQEADVPADASHETAHGSDAAAQDDMQNDLVAILASADAADGTADKVVSKCAGCKLRMDGSADHTLMVEGYEMHLCSEDCKTKVAADTEKAIMALKQ